MTKGPNDNDGPPDLVLTASRYQFYQLLVFPAAIVGAVALLHDIRTDKLWLGTWLFVGGMSLAALFGVASMLSPTRLLIDRQGVAFRLLFLARRYRWQDIEAVGIARSKAFDGWDQPAARAVMGSGHRAAQQPRVGIILKPDASGEKNLATRAYKRGFTGYDVHIPGLFELSLGRIVEEMQIRLDLSRAPASA